MDVAQALADFFGGEAFLSNGKNPFQTDDWNQFSACSRLSAWSLAPR